MANRDKYGALVSIADPHSRSSVLTAPYLDAPDQAQWVCESLTYGFLCRKSPCQMHPSIFERKTMRALDCAEIVKQKATFSIPFERRKTLNRHDIDTDAANTHMRSIVPKKRIFTTMRPPRENGEPRQLSPLKPPGVEVLDKSCAHCGIDAHELQDRFSRKR